MPKDYKRKKKRKFTGNRYGAKPAKKACVDNANDLVRSEASTSSDDLHTSASARKIDGHNI